MTRGPAALAFLLLLAGCASKPDRTVTLRFWGMGREGEVVSELVPEFERRHPGVRIEVQQIPWSAAHEKLLTGYVGRSMPDLFQLGNTWVSEFAALGALEPLDARVAASTVVDPESFFSGIWDTNVVDGVTWGLPWYVDTRVIFYRKDLLREAGFDSFPGDWDGWRRAMDAMKARAGNDRYVLFLPLNEWNPQAILGLSAGSSLLGARDTKGAFSGPEFRRGFDFYLACFNDRLAPPFAHADIANVYQEFDRGYISMWITGPWNVGEFRRRVPADRQDTWGTAPFPGPTGPSDGLSLAGGSSLAIYRGSPHREVAWQFVEYLSEVDTQLRFHRLTGDLPARIEAWRDTALSNDPEMMAFGEQLRRVVSTPKVPEWEQIAFRLQERTEQAVRGAATPAVALGELDKDVDKILEKRRWLVEKRAADRAHLP
ncbi:MAG TPA: sugar ABC transporter substrate-binding protein [Candidatus Eisenbacteria bacterium]